MPMVEMLSSSLRSVPLRMRPDLEFARLGEQADAGWAVKDPLALQFHRLETVHFAVLQRLDGHRNLKELLADVARECPSAALTLDELQILLMDFHEKGLVVSERFGQARTQRIRHRKELLTKLRGALGGILSLRLPGWNPVRELDALLPWVRWVYHPAAITMFGVLVLASWLMVLVQFAEFQKKLPEFQQFFGWPNVMWLWVSLAATKILHEFGHGLTCHYYGRRCHEMGVMVLMFTPTLYCDVTDAWLIRDRWPRIWIGAAGVIYEVVLSAFAIFIWWFTEAGLINHLALNVFFVSTISTVIFNANPLMRYDGYYMLSDYLEIPNLRSKADRLLDRLLARWVYGLDVNPDPFLPQHHQGLFALFSVASVAYGWFVLGGILLFLYTWLKPHDLQSIGVVLALVSLTGFLVSMVMRAWKIGRSPRHGKVRWLTVVAAACLICAVTSAVLAIPIPWYVDAAAIIEPEGVAQIYNPVAGRLKEVRVAPGDHVQAGQTLFVLESDDLADQLKRVTDEIDVQRVSVDAARAADAAVDRALAEEHLASLLEMKSTLEKQIAHLVVKAPTAGKIVSPEYRFPPSDKRGAPLPHWHATPLDAQNLDAWFEPRTHLASIAPSEKLQAVLYLPQAHRDEVRVGTAASLKLDALPGRVFRGELAELSHAQAETVPMPLSSKAGGPLATVTLPDQTEQLQELAYQGRMQLSDDAGIVRTGMRGTARFVISRHTAGWWLGQTLRRLFRFRL